MDREHVKGFAEKTKGAVKEGAGKVSGDKTLQNEGKRLFRILGNRAAFGQQFGMNPHGANRPAQIVARPQQELAHLGIGAALRHRWSRGRHDEITLTRRG